VDNLHRYTVASTGLRYWLLLCRSRQGALMVLFKASHPPAGATTLIVSLGVIAQPKDLIVIEAAVILLTVRAFVLNRFAGMPYPLWGHQPSSADGV
jgi:CBS domain-containing membrane protein